MVKLDINVQDPLIIEGFLIGKTTTWAGGLAKQATFTPDSGFLVHTPNQTTQTVPYGKQLSSTDYAYDVSVPGAALSGNGTDYVALSNPSYLQANRLELESATISKDYVSGGTRAISYTYDAPATGNLTSVKRHLDTTNVDLETTYTYTPYGLVSSVTMPSDPLTPSTTATYNGAYSGAVPTSIKDALQHESTATYDSLTLRLTSKTDANGRATAYEYDGAGRLHRITYADGGEHTYSYPSSNEIDETVRLDGSQTVQTQIFFDGLGRKIKTVQQGAAQVAT